MPAEFPIGEMRSSPFAPKAAPRIPDHEVLRCIGSGSYGEVWLARSVLGTFRAIKVVYRSTFDDARPFEREFSGIEKFEPIARSSEGLVHILQTGRNHEEGYFYYVMELADNATFGGEGRTQISPDTYTPRTLATEKLRQGKLPAKSCLQYGIALTRALDDLHRSGLIHRDIKPSNIVFVKDAPKLADIGLVADMSEAHSYVGTEGFIPPEGPNSKQADIYSLGKVLYEVAMGKDRQDFPEPCSDLVENPDRKLLIELNAIILKACDPDLSRRYKNAREMHEELRLLESGKSVREKRASARRLKVISLLAGAGLIFALLVFTADRLLAWKIRSIQGQSTAIKRELIGKVQERDSSAPLYTIDLSAFYNAPLIERWYPGPEANTLDSLPRGMQKLAGTEFDLRGLVQLSGQEIRSYGAQAYPNSVTGIPIGRWVKRLHFLQGAVSEVADAKTIGSYKIEFASGRSTNLSIVYGRDLRALWQPAEDPPELPGSTLAWRGQNPATRERQLELRLYKRTWENPWPDDEIIDVHFNSANANSAPFLVALTCDEHEPPPGQNQLPSTLLTLLQTKAPAFQRLPVSDGSPGTSELTSIRLNENPHQISGRYYDGFRFATPPREPRDLVWAFASSTNLHAFSWYILPMQGVLKVGFEDWYHGIPEIVPGSPASPELTLQFLGAKKLQPNRDYFIWFVFDQGHPVDLNLALRFVTPGLINPNQPHTLLRAMEINEKVPPQLRKFHRHYCLGAVR